MILPRGAHLNTPHPLLTESRKLWTRYSSGQMTGVFRSVKWRHRPHFSPSLPPKVAMKLGNKTLLQVETPTSLGVKLDTRLSWKPHTKDMETKGITKLAVLKKVSGTHRGASSKILKTVCMGAVRPSLEYEAHTHTHTWATAVKTHTNKLDNVQNIGLKTILGAMKTTPITVMENTAGVEPLESRRQAKLLIHAEKMKRMPDHPLHQKLKDPTKNKQTQIEKETFEPPSKRTAERACRNP